MKKKRPRRKASKPPPERRTSSRRPGLGKQAEIRRPGPLQYKVAELSAVDESSLERTINEWVAQGWALDGIQFAMRESSKRPSMAFVLFTREGPAGAADLGRSEAEAREAVPAAYERLAQLAGEDEPPG
jgi:hypothetical protein